MQKITFGSILKDVFKTVKENKSLVFFNFLLFIIIDIILYFIRKKFLNTPDSESLMYIEIIYMVFSLIISLFAKGQLILIAGNYNNITKEKINIFKLFSITIKKYFELIYSNIYLFFRVYFLMLFSFFVLYYFSDSSPLLSMAMFLAFIVVLVLSIRFTVYYIFVDTITVLVDDTKGKKAVEYSKSLSEMFFWKILLYIIVIFFSMLLLVVAFGTIAKSNIYFLSVSKVILVVFSMIEQIFFVKFYTRLLNSV